MSALKGLPERLVAPTLATALVAVSSLTFGSSRADAEDVDDTGEVTSSDVAEALAPMERLMAQSGRGSCKNGQRLCGPH